MNLSKSRTLALFCCMLGALLLMPRAWLIAQEPTETQAPTEILTATFTGAWHGYILIEWSAQFTTMLQRPRPTLTPCKGCPEPPPDATAILTTDPIGEAMNQLAPSHGNWPPYLLQVRYSLDGLKAIVEARFDVQPSQEDIINRLSGRSGVLPAQMGTVTVIVFAPGGTWQESQQACLEYLNKHVVDWQEPLP
jgi:hypothetical protein